MVVFVKLCGMNSEAAVAAALEAGADALGFVFAPSVRRVAPAEARRLAAPARGRASCVAVMLYSVPPMSTTMLAMGSSIGRSAPIAAAIGCSNN